MVCNDIHTAAMFSGIPWTGPLPFQIGDRRAPALRGWSHRVYNGENGGRRGVATTLRQVYQKDSQFRYSWRCVPETWLREEDEGRNVLTFPAHSVPGGIIAAGGTPAPLPSKAPAAASTELPITTALPDWNVGNHARLLSLGGKARAPAHGDQHIQPARPVVGLSAATHVLVNMSSRYPPQNSQAHILPPVSHAED